MPTEKSSELTAQSACLRDSLRSITWRRSTCWTTPTRSVFLQFRLQSGFYRPGGEQNLNVISGVDDGIRTRNNRNHNANVRSGRNTIPLKINSLQGARQAKDVERRVRVLHSRAKLPTVEAFVCIRCWDRHPQALQRQLRGSRMAASTKEFFRLQRPAVLGHLSLASCPQEIADLILLLPAGASSSKRWG